MQEINKSIFYYKKQTKKCYLFFISMYSKMWQKTLIKYFILRFPEESFSNPILLSRKCIIDLSYSFNSILNVTQTIINKTSMLHNIMIRQLVIGNIIFLHYFRIHYFPLNVIHYNLLWKFFFLFYAFHGCLRHLLSLNHKYLIGSNKGLQLN